MRYLLLVLLIMGCKFFLLAQDDSFLDSSFSDSLVEDEEVETIEERKEDVDTEVEKIQARQKAKASIEVEIQEAYAHNLSRNKKSFLYREEEWKDSGLYVSPLINAMSLRVRGSYFTPRRYVGFTVDNTSYIYIRDKQSKENISDINTVLANNLSEAYLEINPLSWWSIQVGKMDIAYGNGMVMPAVDYLSRNFYGGEGLRRELPGTGTYLVRNSFFTPWFSLSLIYIPNLGIDNLREFSANRKHSVHLALELLAFQDFNPGFLFFTDSDSYRIGITISGGIGAEVVLYTDLSLEMYPEMPKFLRFINDISLGGEKKVGNYAFQDIRSGETGAIVGGVGISYTPASIVSMLLEIRGNSAGIQKKEWHTISGELNALHRDYATVSNVMNSGQLSNSVKGNLQTLKEGYVQLLDNSYNAFQPVSWTPMLIIFQISRSNVLRYSAQSLGFSAEIMYLVFDNSFISAGEITWGINDNLEFIVRAEYAYGAEGSMINALLYPARIFTSISLYL